MPRYGIVGAAVITVASELVILVGSYWLMRRHFDFFPRRARCCPAAAAAAVMGALLWLLATTRPLIALVPLGALVYGGLLCAISPPSRHLFAGRALMSAAERRARHVRAAARAPRHPLLVPRRRRRSSRWTTRWWISCWSTAGASVLDLGCGLGGYSRVLADRGREVSRLDVLPEYVERARALGWTRGPTTASGCRSRTIRWTR